MCAHVLRAEEGPEREERCNKPVGSPPTTSKNETQKRIKHFCRKSCGLCDDISGMDSSSYASHELEYEPLDESVDDTRGDKDSEHRTSVLIEEAKNELKGHLLEIKRQNSDLDEKVNELVKSMNHELESKLSNVETMLFDLLTEAKKYKYSAGSASEGPDKEKDEVSSPSPPNLEPFCKHWSSADALNRTLQPFDMWHTHNPTWIISNETDDRFCVEVGNVETHPYIEALDKFYANQFQSKCDRVHLRGMWSSGWGADFTNMQAGMVSALNEQIPLVLEVDERKWHYAANKGDASNKTCSAGDITCYFLPYTNCGPAEEVRRMKKEGDVDTLEHSDMPEGGAFITQESGMNAYLFLTRKQLWLRRAVFDYKEEFKRANSIQRGSDCTVIHVRRSDVILHHDYARRFYM